MSNKELVLLSRVQEFEVNIRIAKEKREDRELVKLGGTANWKTLTKRQDPKAAYLSPRRSWELIGEVSDERQALSDRFNAPAQEV